eukprot:CAMPEP_0167745924 /NCGR_PEP_ID=MMETSP0110_2-20121227/3420_1 /TAXON_ID=629695 /ORGANISM="Gymnochlora sp., Strain CCMP2014" /LENGTH=422 /DNA_ID=CAMNT_0007630617 /DNA_START=54 /DNA_END=1322 /DNA_ORIENTATION=+
MAEELKGRIQSIRWWKFRKSEEQINIEISDEIKTYYERVNNFKAYQNEKREKLYKVKETLTKEFEESKELSKFIDDQFEKMEQLVAKQREATESLLKERDNKLIKAREEKSARLVEARFASDVKEIGYLVSTAYDCVGKVAQEAAISSAIAAAVTSIYQEAGQVACGEKDWKVALRDGGISMVEKTARGAAIGTAIGVAQLVGQVSAKGPKALTKYLGYELKGTFGTIATSKVGSTTLSTLELLGPAAAHSSTIIVGGQVAWETYRAIYYYYWGKKHSGWMCLAKISSTVFTNGGASLGTYLVGCYASGTGWIGTLVCLVGGLIGTAIGAKIAKSLDKAFFKSHEEGLRNAYKALGCEERDSMADINKKFRKLVLACHPDKCVHLTLEMQKTRAEEFLKLQTARDLISVSRRKDLVLQRSDF